MNLTWCFLLIWHFALWSHFIYKNPIVAWQASTNQRIMVCHKKRCTAKQGSGKEGGITQTLSKLIHRMPSYGLLLSLIQAHKLCNTFFRIHPKTHDIAEAFRFTRTFHQVRWHLKKKKEKEMIGEVKVDFSSHAFRIQSCRHAVVWLASKITWNVLLTFIFYFCIEMATDKLSTNLNDSSGLFLSLASGFQNKTKIFEACF